MNLTVTRPSAVVPRSLFDRSLAWLRTTTERVFAGLTSIARMARRRARVLAEWIAARLGTSSRRVALAAYVGSVCVFVLLAALFLRPPTP